MATAVQNTKEVAVEKVVVETQQVPDGATLNLSQEEAQFLLDLLGNFVTGSTKGPRGLSDSICDALLRAGFTYDNGELRRKAATNDNYAVYLFFAE